MGNKVKKRLPSKTQKGQARSNTKNGTTTDSNTKMTDAALSSPTTSSTRTSSSTHRKLAMMVLMLSIAFQQLPLSFSSWRNILPPWKMYDDAIETKKGIMPQFSSQDKIDRFLVWLNENGASISNHVTISSFPEFGGYGLLAVPETTNNDDDDKGSTNHDDSVAIHEMDQLFTIPSNIIISTRTFLEEYTMHIPNLQQRLQLILQSSNVQSSMVQQDIVIGLYLLVQKKLGKRSQFHPYLDILPQGTIPRLDTFEEEALELLNDADLVSLAKDSYYQLTLVWNHVDLKRIVSSLLQQTSRVADGEESSGTLPSFEEFHKFVSIVSSRAMVLHGTKYLTPLAGMANYKPRRNQEILQKGNKKEPVKPFTLYHERDTINHSITVRADRNVQFGHQIFEDYGELDNSLYLEAHGFVPNVNPYHCATLQGQYLPSPMNLSDSLVEILIRLRILPQGNVSFLPSICVRHDGSIIDERGKAYLKVAALDVMGKINGHLLQRCIDTLHSDDVELMALQCIHYPGNGLVLNAMIKNSAREGICSASPDSSSSSIEQDLVLLASFLSQERILPSLEERAHVTQKRLALQFRLSDKHILWNLGDVNTFNCSVEYDAFKSVSLDSNLLCPSLENASVHQEDSERRHSQSLDIFNSYIDALDIDISKIKAEYIGNGMRIGVVATQDIEKGETYFSINSASVIDSDTIILEETLRESINKLLMRFKRQNDGGFKAMLWFLMYEAFVMKEKSPWHPYLKLLPTIEELRVSSPLFFDESALVYLAGSDLRNAILQNQRTALDAMELAFSDTDVMNVFKSRIITRENFLWAHHILDSR